VTRVLLWLAAYPTWGALCLPGVLYIIAGLRLRRETALATRHSPLFYIPS